MRYDMRMQRAEEVLQIRLVLEEVASFSRTEQGKEALLSLTPFEEERWKEEDRDLEEAMNLIDAHGALPLTHSRDMSSRIDAARKGATLAEEDFSIILDDLQTMRELKKHLAQAGGEGYRLTQTLGLPELEPLRQGILRVFAPDMSIKDNASVDLKRIRGNLARKKREITQRLGSILEAHKGYMSGNTWTMRNGHYVLPIAPSYKHQVKGIVHDISSSGGTTFIEPEALVILQNDIALLEAEEKEEIRRILASLSRIAGNNAKDYLRINETLGLWDYLQAKALYAQKIHGHRVKLSHDGTLSLIKARHPLLDQSKVVPNDFLLSSSRRVLVLSGPNAGGKTVALKTLGILSLLFSMAIPLPCEAEGEMPLFGNVFVDIGDSQSIFDNLSTFSGHITHVRDILREAKKGDLVLLDELGTGTSPKEGEALALAILDELAGRGCYALLSSHFEGLKARALASQDVENASLLFDEKTLSPTYSLRIGLPGESYGLEVARRLGLDEKVLEKAKGYLGNEEEASVSSSLRHLGELAHEAEEKQKRIDALQAHLSAKQRELARKENELKRKLESFEKENKKLREELLQKAQEEVEEAIHALRDPDVKLHEAIEAKRKLEELDESAKEVRAPVEVHVGDYVEILDYEVEGRVNKIRGGRLEVVSRDGMTFTLSKEDVRLIDEPKQEKKVSVTNVDALPSKGLPLEVNLIGLRVAEAMAELDRYLDRCRLKGYKRVRVIHGLGSGALRKATHEYCKSHSFIDKYELAGEYEGGGGATVVYLK